MWERGKEELGWLGITEDDWMRGWARRIPRGDAVIFGDCAILGCDWVGTDEVTTIFQASKDFELPGVGKRITKEMRSEIPRMMKARGIRRACVYSLCVEPHAAKWFRLLGFNEDTNYKGVKRGPYTTRRFIREA